MADSFLPSTDSGLFAWGENFLACINSDPESVGLTPELVAQFALLQASYGERYQTAAARGSRTMADVVAKNDARTLLRDEARRLVAMVRAFGGNVTDAQKIAMGLTVPAGTRTRASAPAEPPAIRIESTIGRTVHLLLSDKFVARRGRLPRSAGAVVFTFTGDHPPADFKKWDFAGLTISRKYEVEFPSDTPPGAKVHFSAQWLSTRLERGPFADVISVHIPGGFSGARIGTLNTLAKAA